MAIRHAAAALPVLCTRRSPGICHSATSDTATSSELLDYILEGSLLGPCGLDAASVREQLPEWERLGRRLAQQLGFQHDHMDPIQRLRVYRYYLPVFFWVQQQMQQHKQRHAGQATTPPMVLGISAPQGCGKTTIVEQMEQLFDWLGVKCASVSIDDFYLTNNDQTGLAQAQPDNRLLQLRGNAGTHDLELGRQTLQQLRGLTQAGQQAAVPRYDKSAYQGRGDRAPRSAWPTVEGPLDIVLFEGWMLGFRPVGAEAAGKVEAALAEVDARLAAYQQAWDACVDSWLVVRIDDPQWVYGWRLQAEQRMRAEGKPGMTDEQIADFVSRYIPAYTAYLPGLYAHGPTTAQPGRTLTIQVDSKRSPVQQQALPVV